MLHLCIVAFYWGILSGCPKKSTPFNWNLSRNLTKYSIKGSPFFRTLLYIYILHFIQGCESICFFIYKLNKSKCCKKLRIIKDILGCAIRWILRLSSQKHLSFTRRTLCLNLCTGTPALIHGNGKNFWCSLFEIKKYAYVHSFFLILIQKEVVLAASGNDC